MNEVRTMRGQTLKSANMLDLGGLQIVQWAQEQQLIMAIFHLVAQVYARLKGMIFIGWFLVISEMIVVWWWTFLHNLPWPQFVLSAISTVDGIAVRILDFLQRRVEWWWDVVSVRLMWFRESIENVLDRYLTIADKYFAMLQDLILAVYNLIMTPFRAIFEKVASYDESQEADEKEKLTTSKSTMPLLNKNGSLRRNSGEYPYINEDLGDEDYLSDTSIDSRRFMTEDDKGQVYTRYRTTATAEGKFREAMYHRVSNELGLMRKNSIRFSRGLVNCARQMVGVRTQEYAESFLGFFQRWARALLFVVVVVVEGRPQSEPKSQGVVNIADEYAKFHQLWLAEAQRNAVAPVSPFKTLSSAPKPTAESQPQPETADAPANDPEQQQPAESTAVQEAEQAQPAESVTSAPDMNAAFANFHALWKVEAARNAIAPTVGTKRTEPTAEAPAIKDPQLAQPEEAATPAPDMNAAFANFHALWKIEAARNAIAPTVGAKRTEPAAAKPEAVQPAEDTKLAVAPQEAQTAETSPAETVPIAPDYQAEFARFQELWQQEAARNAIPPVFQPQPVAVQPSVAPMLGTPAIPVPVANTASVPVVKSTLPAASVNPFASFGGQPIFVVLPNWIPSPATKA